MFPLYDSTIPNEMTYEGKSVGRCPRFSLYKFDLF